MPANTVEELETFTVTATNVPCDGGGALGHPLGHPKVYLKVDPATGEVVCPYCSRRFVLDPHAKAGAGH